MSHILIVEDNEMNRDVLSRWFSLKGYNVSVAGDGESGISAARTRRPDVVLMDVDLPGIDGWEAARRIHADPVLSDVPVVALTAYAFTEHREKATESGCVAFETKPVDFDRLAEKLEKLWIRKA